MNKDFDLSSDYLAQESKIYQKQEILFVLIDILFIFHLVMLLAFLHFYRIDTFIEQIIQIYYPILWILLSISYEIFGLIITFNCSQMGLRIFAWVGIVLLISRCFIFVSMLLLPLYGKTKYSHDSMNYFYSSRYVIFIGIWITISTLLLICVQFAFKLCKLITNLQQKEKELMLLWQI